MDAIDKTQFALCNVGGLLMVFHINCIPCVMPPQNRKPKTQTDVFGAPLSHKRIYHLNRLNHNVKVRHIHRHVPLPPAGQQVLAMTINKLTNFDDHPVFGLVPAGHYAVIEDLLVAQQKAIRPFLAAPVVKYGRPPKMSQQNKQQHQADQEQQQQQQQYDDEVVQAVNKQQMLVLQGQVASLQKKLKAECQKMAAERQNIAVERDQLEAERDQIAAEREQLVAEREQIAVRRQKLIAQR